MQMEIKIEMELLIKMKVDMDGVGEHYILLRIEKKPYNE